jgi:hypothetical protein
MDINYVLRTHFVKALLQDTCGTHVEVIQRPASYVLRSAREGDRENHRLIILPPHGFTADKLEQTNSHDEAEYATIQVKGAVRQTKDGFSKLRDCLKVVSIPENGTTSELNKPYLTYDPEGDDNPDLEIRTHSAGTPAFSVVKSDGYGFYHNLINKTDDWLVLQLYKRLRPQRHVDLSAHLQGLEEGQKSILESLYQAIVLHGDEVFYKAPKLIEAVTRMPLSVSLPALGEMLYVRDTGKHEACSAFAIILKIGRLYPDEVRGFLENSLKEKTVPDYYARQLVQKIENTANAQPAPMVA